MLLFLQCVLLLLLGCPKGAALYEDEAGKFDWYKEKIGTVTHGVFPSHPRLMKQKLVFVATAESTVAALDIDSGHVIWRKVLAEGEGIVDIRLCDQAILVVTGSWMVHAWGAVEGTLLWSAGIRPSAPSTLLKGVLLLDESTAGIVAMDVNVSGTFIHVFTVALQDGALAEELTFPVDVPLIQGFPMDEEEQQRSFLNDLVQLVPQGLVIVNPLQGLAAFFDGTTGASATFSFLNVLPQGADMQQIRLANVRQTCSCIFLWLSPNVAAILALLDGGLRITHVVTVDGPASLVFCDVDVERAGSVLALEVRFGLKDYGLRLLRLPAAASGPIPLAAAAAAIPSAGLLQTVPGGVSGGGGLLMATVNSFLTPEGHVDYRALMVTEDGTVQLVSDKGVLWRRIEGLATLSKAHFVDLPKARPHQPGANVTVLARFAMRLILQAVTFEQQLRSFSQWVVEETMHRMQITKSTIETEDEAGGELAMTQDEFGFRKLIVTYSQKTGMLYALHTARGRIAWRHYIKHAALAAVLPELSGGPSDDAAAFLWHGRRCQVNIEGGHDVDERYQASVLHAFLLLCSVRCFDSQQFRAQPKREFTILFKFSVQSGVLLNTKLYPRRMVHWMALPLTALVGPATTSPILLVDTQKDVHLYPDEPAVWDVVRQHGPRLFFHLTNVSGGYTIGHGFSLDCRTAREVWRVAVDTNKGEAIVAVSAASVDRHALAVHSAIKLFTNGTGAAASAGPQYGFKFLNPNAFALATSLPAPANAEERDSKSVAGPTLHFYLMDGVTGSVLAQTVHANAAPPVRILHVENFVLYHFLNTKTMKHQLGMWQLFDDPLGSNARTVAQGLLSTITGAQLLPRSAFTVPPPMITRTMYAFPTAIRDLKSSVTTRGITTKLIFVGNPLGQVIGLPLPTVEASKVDYISYPATAILLYNQTVNHIRLIHSSPTSLESSSHLLAIGLDVFYTRVAPAKSYDLLGDDFSYWLLLTTTSALFICTIVAQGFAKRRALSLAWT